MIVQIVMSKLVSYYPLELNTVFLNGSPAQ